MFTDSNGNITMNPIVQIISDNEKDTLRETSWYLL